MSCRRQPEHSAADAGVAADAVVVAAPLELAAAVHRVCGTAAAVAGWRRGVAQHRGAGLCVGAAAAGKLGCEFDAEDQMSTYQVSVLRLLVRLAMQEEQDSSNETASRARYATKLRLVARRRPFSKGQAWCNISRPGREW